MGTRRHFETFTAGGDTAAPQSPVRAGTHPPGPNARPHYLRSTKNATIDAITSTAAVTAATIFAVL